MSKNDDMKLRLFRERPYCGIYKEPLTIVETFSKRVNIDHRIPRHEGGKDHISNLDLAHKTCNTQKGSYVPQT